MMSSMPKLDMITPDTMQMPDIKVPDLSKSGATSGVSGATGSSDSFASMFGRMVEEVNAKQIAASDAVSGMQGGQNVPLHQTVIAMEEASISFQLMVEVRNKLLESYQEIMRMQI